MKDIGNFKDEVVGANYSLQIFPSAKDLSTQLKSSYKSMKIDYKEFNTSDAGSDVVENPPAEIYEYQNFFLLEKLDGKVVLLDGFRRLLWYNCPNAPILVRIYKQSDLTDGQILTLLVHLNHFKFFSHSSYQERGFGLLLKTVFDIDITKFREAFDAYLSSDNIKNDYGVSYNRSSGSDKIETIKDRILNPLFIEDMKFISKLNESGCMVNTFFGALVYKKRLEQSLSFDTDKFLELHKKDKVVAGLIVKFEKAGTNSSAKSMEVVNQIMEMYINIFKLMLGDTVEKSYAEKMQECKELREALNKDKNWTKLTGNQSSYLIERAMYDKLDNLNFKCLVYPREEPLGSWNNHKPIPLSYGINDLVKFISIEKKRMHATDMVFGFTDPSTGASWEIKHNYGGWNSYGKKYTKVDFQFDKEISEKYSGKNGFSSCSYDIELWVDLKKSDWEEKKKPQPSK